MVKLPGGITIISGHSSQSLNLVPGRNWPTSSAHPTAATAAIEKARKKREKIPKGQSPVISSPPEDTKVPHCSASLANDGHRFLATRKPITSLRFPESEVSRREERRGVGSVTNHGVPRMTRELQPELVHAAPSLGAPW